MKIDVILILVVLAIVVGLLLGGTFSPANLSEAERVSKQAEVEYQNGLIRATVVTSAQAQADAESIVARNRQTISETTQTQALRHAGEVAALTISNTQRTAEISTTFAAAIAGIEVKRDADKAAAVAAMEERAASARIATGVSIGLVVFVIVVGVGGSFAANRALRNRARVHVLLDDGRNQVIMIDGHILHKTAQQLGESTVYQEPSSFERAIMLLAAARIAIASRSLEPLVQWKQLGTVTMTSSATPDQAALLKLDNNSLAGFIASQAVHASPQAAQQISHVVVSRATGALDTESEPELLMLDDPAQRRHLEKVLEMSR